VRRPQRIRSQAFLAGSVSLAIAIAVAFVVHLLLGRGGRLGFEGVNLAGLAEGAAFLVALMTSLTYARGALRLPGPVLSSFGLLAPPTAKRVAENVPIVEGSAGLHTLAEHRVVIVQDQGVPIGVSGMRRERITSWDEVVKVPGDVSVTDLRLLLAHEKLVVVTEGERVLGVVTQEAYLAGLWGRVR
jgi:hypothetical protein